MQHIQLSFLAVLLFFSSNTNAQQGYSGNSVLDCDHQSTRAPSSSYLYTCNGLKTSCQAFLIFKSQPNYNSVMTISHLLSADPSELARINDVSASFAFPINKEVIIPVNCSCSGQYYQANTSYVSGDNDTYDNLANDRYQGLSSCSALAGENPYKANDVTGDLDLIIPLRCACPTNNQKRDGTKYLLTYSINEGDSLSDLSDRFNVSYQETLSANGFSEQDPVIYPSTTVLFPLQRELLSSQTIIYYPIQYNPPPPPLYPKDKRSNRGLHVVIATIVLSLLALCLAILVVLWCTRKRMQRSKRKKISTSPKDTLNAMARINCVLKVYEVEELKAATKDFSSECRIEGSVYRGVVNGAVFAVKKLNRDVSKEVNILNKLNHCNLISLCGIGMGEEHCYLVYEYMENGSLRNWLHDSSQSGLWSWTQRVQIALDVANGLDYLHNLTDPPYVHKDINSSNVLLNAKMRAKITNFSLARSSEYWRAGGSTLTKNVEGTLGYMPPEYLHSGLVTPRLDVYAFGVLMAELITGKHAVNENEGRNGLLSKAIVSMVEGRHAEVELSSFMESAIRNSSPIGLVMEVARLSVACLRNDPEKRPTMYEVLSVLSRIQTDSQRWESAYKRAVN